VHVRSDRTSSRFVGWIVVLIAAVAIVFGAVVTTQSTGQTSPAAQAAAAAPHQPAPAEFNAGDHGRQATVVAAVSPSLHAAPVNSGFLMNSPSDSDQGSGDGSCPMLAAACMIALVVLLVSWRLRRPGTSVIRLLPRITAQARQNPHYRRVPAVRSPLMLGICLT